MLVRKDDKTTTLFGDDLGETVRWLQNTPRSWREGSSVTHPSSQEWSLGANWERTLQLARDGWAEGMRMVEMAAAEVQTNARTSTFRYDVAGELPDVSRFAAGDPLHMVSRARQKQNHPVVHIIVNVNCSGSINAKRFAEYGGALTALVDQIENTRRRVELDVLAVNTHQGRGRSRCGWKVKRAEDQLDLSAIAFSIAHPAAFRRLIFALWERTPASYHTYGYGTVSDIARSDAEAMDTPDAILFDGVGKAASGVSVAEMNRRLARNVEKALGIQIIAEEQ